MPLNKLQAFVNDMISSAGADAENGDFRFDLIRWSEEHPYWCVFACEHGDKGVVSIGGHFCIEKEANLHDILSILADSEWRVEVHSEYFE